MGVVGGVVAVIVVAAAAVRRQVADLEHSLIVDMQGGIGAGAHIARAALQTALPRSLHKA